jgi:hypothetical protein
MSVIIKIMGGLASQMHKYAIGRAVAVQCNSDLMLDLSWFNNVTNGDTKRDFQLDKFATRYTIASQDSIGRVKSSVFRQRLTSIAKKIGLTATFLKKTHYVKGFDVRDVLSVAAPVYIEGEWFGSVYIDGIRDILLDDFSLKVKLDENARAVLKDIISVESVAIHVRRGDYISNPLAASLHCLTEFEYYKAAVDYCISTLEDPVFFVFSDDLPWVVDAFSSLQGIFVYVNNNQPFEDLELMKTCKHQVICNSGFSWFGAWLNTFEGKLNIAPKNWVMDTNFNKYINDDLIKSKILLF